jgi:hypothetical protein
MLLLPCCCFRNAVGYSAGYLNSSRPLHTSAAAVEVILQAKRELIKVPAAVITSTTRSGTMDCLGKPLFLPVWYQVKIGFLLVNYHVTDSIQT